MNASRILTFLLLVALVPAAASVSSARPATPLAAQAQLEDHMQILQSNSKRLDKALEKQDLAAALTAVVEMQAAVHQAKLLSPLKAGALADPAAKKQMSDGFRKQMIELQKALLDCEKAAVDGNAVLAKKILEESIKPAKKVGHDQYKD
jgi:hypothetical protein